MTAVGHPASTEARGPYFDELRHGQVFDGAPGVTLTDGAAAVHQAILGDRLALATDHEFARRVAGGRLAHPAHVWDVAIGQSTEATHFVRANLFYRGLVFRRFPRLGDTLYTRTEVVGLKQNSVREGRPRTGLAALHITTRDQHGSDVLDFHRCAMLPLGPGAADTGHADDLSGIGDRPDMAAALTALDLAALAGTRQPTAPAPGQCIEVVGATSSRVRPSWRGSRSTSRRSTTTPAPRGDAGSCTAGTPSEWPPPRSHAHCRGY
jgi:acyl dehydratase